MSTEENKAKESKPDYTKDLSIISKSKKVVFQSDLSDKKTTLILHPFTFKNFNTVISLVKKYWDCYLKVGEYFAKGQDEIIKETIEDESPKRRQLLIENYEDNFNEVALLVQNILNSGEEDLTADIATLINFCLRQEFDLESLNIGEITVLLLAAIEINMDFFDQNLKKLELLKESKVSQAMPRTGGSKSAA